VRTGSVLGPPAVRPQETFATRVTGDTLEIEIGAAGAVSVQDVVAAPAVKPKRKKYWKQMGIFSACALVFWYFEFVYQYKVLIPGEFGGSLVRSFALAGATLFGCALFSSAIFRWFPRTARLWRFRRYMGVSGFIFTFFHVLSVYKYLFDFDVKAVYYTFNPIENPIIFGSIAFPIFFVLAATSTDWAVDKIGSKRWKFIHRFVYLAYVASIFHFITINPSLLKNPAGYLLLTMTALAGFGMLFWYVKTVLRRGWKIMGAWVGLALILGTAVLGYVVYRKKFYPHTKGFGVGVNVPPTEERVLAEAVVKMKKFMEENPEGDEEIVQEPIAEDQSFVGLTVKQGMFQNLNYMSFGGASIEKKGERYYMMFHEDFSTPNGPDLQVYLTKNSEPTRRKDVQDGVLLGKLKSIMGKQVYEIPEDVNVDGYNSVTIHCKAFNVPWSFAPLK